MLGWYALGEASIAGNRLLFSGSGLSQLELESIGEFYSRVGFEALSQVEIEAQAEFYSQVHVLDPAVQIIRVMMSGEADTNANVARSGFCRFNVELFSRGIGMIRSYVKGEAIFAIDIQMQDNLYGRVPIPQNYVPAPQHRTFYVKEDEYELLVKEADWRSV